jgi:D-glycero-alpha-D-manno-heptose-7-phosphate kinase
MLIVRAPVRISFAGGGTDLPAYYERHGGFVVSTTIDKYFYLVVNSSTPDGVQISSSDYRVFSRHQRTELPLWDGDLGLVKAALHEFGCEAGLSLFLASEIPPGTGLGSSSAVAVALVKALTTLRGWELTSAEVAELACVLELDRLNSPIGKQDQYAAAFGGVNAMTFVPGGVTVEPVRIAAKTQERLQRRLLLFFTGAARSANTILQQQRRASADDDGKAVAALHRIKAAALETLRCLEHGDVRRFGELLAESWEQKKRLANGISTSQVDEMYELARRHGALGGKLAGAGGGGFLMLYCEKPYRAVVAEALERAGLFRLAFRFERGGAQVLMNGMARSAPWPAPDTRRVAPEYA